MSLKPPKKSDLDKQWMRGRQRPNVPFQPELWSAREAILNGAKFDELSFQSVYASNGSSLDMCENCYHTFVEYLR